MGGAEAQDPAEEEQGRPKIPSSPSASSSAAARKTSSGGTAARVSSSASIRRRAARPRARARSGRGGVGEVGEDQAGRSSSTPPALAARRRDTTVEPARPTSPCAGREEGARDLAGREPEIRPGIHRHELLHGGAGLPASSPPLPPAGGSTHISSARAPWPPGRTRCARARAGGAGLHGGGMQAPRSGGEDPRAVASRLRRCLVLAARRYCLGSFAVAARPRELAAATAAARKVEERAGELVEAAGERGRAGTSGGAASRTAGGVGEGGWGGGDGQRE
ncbi:unnamed protein product [Urochloa humidicola]